LGQKKNVKGWEINNMRGGRNITSRARRCFEEEEKKAESWEILRMRIGKKKQKVNVVGVVASTETTVEGSAGSSRGLREWKYT